MRPDDVPVLAMMREALRFHDQRQRITAQNVANADTPDYTPQDLSAAEFERALAAAWTEARGNSSGQSEGAAAASRMPREYRVENAPDRETTINGNAVVLEQQMARAAETRMRYETVLGLYQKSMTLLRLSARGVQS